MIENKKEIYAKSVCMFLAELLRTRKITLKRASEIAQKVVAHINLLDREEDFLKLIKEMTNDFEELFHLERRVMLSIQSSQRLELENKVREFAIGQLIADMDSAVAILQAAVAENVAQNDLCAKFPQFKLFLESKTNGHRE